MRLTDLVAAWNAFFFGPVSVHSISLFRILFGCLLLGDALFVAAHAREYLGPEGLIDHGRYYSRNCGRALSLFLWFPPTMTSVCAVVAAYGLSAAMLALGFLTPVSNLICFIALRSIVNRNPEICNGGDNIARIMCFYLLFTPSGHAYSIDAILFHRAMDAAGATYQPWALRLMQIQIAIVYINACYWKLRGPTYRDGTAIYYATISEHYRRLTVPRFLLSHPSVVVLTWGTLALEFSLGTLIWIEEFRIPLVIAGVLFHLSLEFVLNLHLFGWYMMVCLLLFLDPALPGHFM